MAKIMTLRVKVYTIAELKEANYSAYEKVINKAANFVMEYDQQFINEDLQYSLTEYAKERGYGIEDKSLAWDDNHGGYCIWEGSVNMRVILKRYGAEKKIPPATLAMLQRLAASYSLQAYARRRNRWNGESMYLDADYDVDYDTDERTQARRQAAVDAFSEWLEEDFNDTSGEMLRIIGKEYAYRTSEATLAEEIEENERVFTIDGDDTVWVGRIPEEETL